MTLVQSDWRPKNRRFGHTETRGARARGETLDTARRRSSEQQEEEASPTADSAGTWTSGFRPPEP